MASSSNPLAADTNIVEETYGREGDSAYDSEVASYTTSLASNVTDYKNENGRRYHAYKEGSYIYPNDEKESDRLDIVHKLVEVVLHGKLYLAPIQNPARVLDIGTGTGIWAMEMGDQHPTADILGNDLSPIQPRWVPPNVRFEVDDVEADWAYSQKFDFIHCRSMGTTIRDWPRLIKQCFEFTKPGGYCEFVDFDIAWTSPDNSVPEDSVTLKVNTQFIQAAKSMGIDPSPGPSMPNWCKEAGFTDIVQERFPLPVGTWPADKHLKEVGAWNYLQIMEGLEAFTYAVFTRMLGYTKEEVEVMCATMRKEIRNPKLHSLFYLHVIYGKKPAEEREEGAAVA
ncbi:MAG: hypothetical protein MMC33_001073 [Icmadophila ericetorum]|nr:hypothetical protein [Icmadophila ericetorum]